VLFFSWRFGYRREGIVEGLSGCLYSEQAQYHGLQAVDTHRHSGQQTTVQVAAMRFP
jgi:hypothetical protein